MIDRTSNYIHQISVYSYILNVLGQIAKTMIILACIDRFLITSNRATFQAGLY